MRKLTKKQQEYLHLGSKERAIKKLGEEIKDIEEKLSSATAKGARVRYINKLTFLKSILLTYLGDEPRWNWYKYRKKVREEIIRKEQK